jgi:serine/threonine-protein kinase
MKLLEKKPEERYPSAEALLQALERAAEGERQTPAWKVPLFAAEERPVESEPEAVAVPPSLSPETAREAREEPPPSKDTGSQAEAQQEAPTVAGSPRRARWPLILLASLTVLGLALWLVRSTLAPPPEALLPGFEKGSPPVSTPPRSTLSSLLAAWLCAAAGLGCPAAQVKPPQPEDCPKEAAEAMSRELKVETGSRLRAVVDINQPGDMSEVGVYQDGPVIGRLSMGDGNLPAGTLLHGRLWTGPGIYDIAGSVTRPAVLGRYTQAVLPDGRKFPVCIVLGDTDGRVPKSEGSKPGAAVLARDLPVSPVERWP